MEDLVKALPTAATSPYALAAYVAAVVAFVVAGARLREVRLVRGIIKDATDKKQRLTGDQLRDIIADALDRKVPKNIPADVWLKNQRVKAFVTIAVATLLLIALVAVLSVTTFRQGKAYVDCKEQARIFADNDLIGDSPIWISLSAGEHVVECRRTNGTSWATTVDVERGKDTRVSLVSMHTQRAPTTPPVGVDVATPPPPHGDSDDAPEAQTAVSQSHHVGVVLFGERVALLEGLDDATAVFKLLPKRAQAVPSGRYRVTCNWDTRSHEVQTIELFGGVQQVFCRPPHVDTGTIRCTDDHFWQFEHDGRYRISVYGVEPRTASDASLCVDAQCWEHVLDKRLIDHWDVDARKGQRLRLDVAERNGSGRSEVAASCSGDVVTSSAYYDKDQIRMSVSVDLAEVKR